MGNLLTFAFTVYMRVRQEVEVSWWRAKANVSPEMTGDGICDECGWPIDDHGEDELCEPAEFSEITEEAEEED